MNGFILYTCNRTAKPHTTKRVLLANKLILIVLLGSYMLAVSSPVVTAQETKPVVADEIELLKEEETVSIASRYEQPISEAPSNVYVITEEDIRQSGAPDLPTVLRRIPGIEVMQMSGAEFNVSVRGDNQTVANKLLVMVDGRSIYVDVQGSVLWKMIPVTLPEIKRIEILKGPASAVYGFNAFDGVINIITKSPQDMKGTTIQFGGGGYDTISSAGIHAGTVGKIGYRLSIGHDQNAQWRNSDALAFRSNKFNVNTEYSLTGTSRIKLSGGLVDSNRYDGPITQIVRGSTQPALGYASIGYERPDFFIRAWWYSFSDTVFEGIVPPVSNFVRVTDRAGSQFFSFFGNTYNVDTQHTINLEDTIRFSYGLNYRHNTLSSSATDVFSREDRLGLFAQSEWRATKLLTAVAGVRYDIDTFIDPTVSPRFALLFKPRPDHTFRLAMSVAYRPPTLFETHQDQRVFISLPPPIPSPPSSVSQGSTDLHPEQIISYEAGYQGWYLKHRIRARVDLFFNHISDLIGNVQASPTVNTFRNQGEADIYGGEAGIEFLATRWLSGFANYAYEEIGQTFVGINRRGAPRSKVNAGLRAELENGLSGEVAYHYVGAARYPISGSPDAFTAFAPFGVIVPDTRVGSYNLLNMRAGYRFWQQKAIAGYMRDAEVAVSVFNALDDQHKEHPLGDAISRRVMGWLTMRF